MKTVLLAAGFGSRLWPLSTSEKPKQFQTLLGEQSLLQYSYELFSQITNPDELYVLTLRGLEHWVHEQIPAIPTNNVLTVPERRNTLPHTLFALNSITSARDEPVLFSGTDLFITDSNSFLASLRDCIEKMDHTAATQSITMACSSSGAIDTNAGYLQPGDAGVTFIEKPDLQTIHTLSEKGPLYKNTFTFIASAASLEPAFTAMDDRLAGQAKALLAADEEKRQAAFLTMPVCDISNAAFSHAPNITACVTDSDFVDLGTYASLHRINEKDAQGNVIFGSVVLDGNCTGNFIANHTDQPLVLIDTSDTVIVQTPWGNIFSPLAQASRIGDIYKQKINKHGA